MLMIIGTLQTIIEQTSTAYEFSLARTNFLLLASQHGTAIGRSATLIEICSFVIVSFVMFAGLTAYTKSLETIPCEEPPTMEEQLLEKVELEQVHPFLKQGKILLRKDEEDSHMLVSIVKLDERLYPKKEQPWYAKLLGIES
ncbi:hypothetical protein R9C00_23645 [Flammeovirgaceae bacterium SG7u.111]|nr:hypothetical protein [Flammeovirgaceae bacterium SG7u.132]WPO34699.1 hypothetical protein R9C00_23645 [Flammeovirgaceae bacterium SG7u.111]